MPPLGKRWAPWFTPLLRRYEVKPGDFPNELSLKVSESYEEKVVAHTGLEPVISALRGQRVNQLHQCAAGKLECDYMGRWEC